MKFGPTPVDDASGAYLVHSLAAGGRTFRKGHLLTEEDCRDLARAGFDTLICARLENDELAENEAAGKIASQIAADGIAAGNPGTGRCNLYADRPGIVGIDAKAIAAFNSIDESVTLATVPDGSRVEDGQIIATIKIITFAVPAHVMAALDRLLKKTGDAPLLRLHPFKRLKASLIQTKLAHTPDRLIEKAERVMADRLASLGSVLSATDVCPHTSAAVTSSIEAQAAGMVDIIFLLGASAIADRRDVLPAALIDAGGEIIRLGLPVDPGNLTLVGKLRGIWVIGVPGSARSPRLHGFDWLLERIAAGLPVDAGYLASLGAGGLLKEMPDRPLSRRDAAPVAVAHGRRLAGVLLAAGSSSRMGGVNKLTEPVAGVPMVRRAARTMLDAGVDPLIVVTGHQREAVLGALEGLPMHAVHNEQYAKGQAGSVARGIREAAESDAEGAMIALGDMPAVRGATVRRLVAAWRNADEPEAAIVLPVFQGHRGNPVIWGRAYFAAIAEIQGDTGARALFDRFRDAIVAVETEDPGVRLDLDTPEALAAYRAGAVEE